MEVDGRSSVRCPLVRAIVFGSSQVQRTSCAQDGVVVAGQFLPVSGHAFRGKGAWQLGSRSNAMALLVPRVCSGRITIHTFGLGRRLSCSGQVARQWQSGCTPRVVGCWDLWYDGDSTSAGTGWRCNHKPRWYGAAQVAPTIAWLLPG
jgi:hypothetical protein